MWRGVRVAEGARLESVYRGNSIMGSNPILSAIAVLDGEPAMPCNLQSLQQDWIPGRGLIDLGSTQEVVLRSGSHATYAGEPRQDRKVAAINRNVMCAVANSGWANPGRRWVFECQSRVHGVPSILKVTLTGGFLIGTSWRSNIHLSESVRCQPRSHPNAEGGMPPASYNLKPPINILQPSFNFLALFCRSKNLLWSKLILSRFYLTWQQ